MTRPSDPTLPRVVILGAGFGGLAAARALARTPAAVTVIDRRNYHLFQPLLYQVATAALSPADIAWPIRSILSRQKNAAVQMGKVTGIDRERREVILEDRRVGFDYLVVATGARHSYFGMDEWEMSAPGLKKIADATHIRERVLLAFERAEVTADPVERQHLLTFVVVGGGPTGVEMAGAVAELANHALARDFRAIDPMDARVVLVEGSARALAQFPPELSAEARAQLERLRVEVRLGSPVQHCDADGVTVGDERIAARTVIWAAGVIASPAAKWLGARHDRAGRILVSPELLVQDCPDVFAIGDTVSVTGPDARPVPGIAPAAKQMGAYVGGAIDARIRGRAHPPPFRYRHHGNLATIGRKAAVADLGWIRLSGFAAWVLWAVAHVWFLIGWRNRIVVALNWLWNYVTFERGARLITAQAEEPATMAEPFGIKSLASGGRASAA
jgi:NADH dehydrogenase FAD-containing subunit